MCWNYVNWTVLKDLHALLLLLVVVAVVVVVVLVSLLSPLCKVFTITYLKQSMFLWYIVLQLFCIYDFCYM